MNYFQDLIKEAIAQDPNNAILYFNLGVVNGDMGNADQARTYYEKAIEIDSNYEAAYLNLVANILQRETPIVEEMNSISGTSKAENERYDSLISKREDLYRECVPILKKYAIDKGVIDRKWNVTTGDKKHIYGLARKSYFAVIEDGDGGEDDFIHTEQFVLIDKERRIRGFYDGTDLKDMEKLKQDMVLLKAEYEN